MDVCVSISKLSKNSGVEALEEALSFFFFFFFLIVFSSDSFSQPAPIPG
jgi:hypothetical protein